MSVEIIFGVPGSGKTTLCAWYAKHTKKRDVFCNVPVLGTYEFDAKNDLGNVLIENSLILIDEASIDFNNRGFKTLPQNVIAFAKLHRHYGDDIIMFSQSYDDMDITFRRLATRFVLVRPSIIPKFILFRPMRKFITIDKESHQIIEGYDWDWLGIRWRYMPPLWKLFDSYEAPPLPQKEFTKYNFIDRYSKENVTTKPKKLFLHRFSGALDYFKSPLVARRGRSEAGRSEVRDEGTNETETNEV